MARYFSSKRQLTFNWLHGVISQKLTTKTAVRTSNPTELCVLLLLLLLPLSSSLSESHYIKRRWEILMIIVMWFSRQVTICTSSTRTLCHRMQVQAQFLQTDMHCYIIPCSTRSLWRTAIRLNRFITMFFALTTLNYHPSATTVNIRCMKKACGGSSKVVLGLREDTILAEGHSN
jgi:hypothetical protein